MARKSIARVAQKAKTADKAFQTSDNFQNFIGRVGVGQNNQMSASTYTFNFLTRNRPMLEALYRSNWVVRQAIDAYSDDMTRTGIEFEGGFQPHQLDIMNAALLDLQIWQKLCDTIRWSRLFGGCIAVFLIDGQDVSRPLRLESIGQDQFKGLFVLDRHMVDPSLNDLITDFGPELGEPKFYSVHLDSPALAGLKVHHSRIFKMDGLPLPYYQRLTENGWGESIVEGIYDRLVSFDSATLGIAQLAYKVHLRTLKVEDLRGIISQGGQVFEGLVKQIETMRLMQSNEGITLLDTTDEFEIHRSTFAGLDTILIQFFQQISGALQIPMVRLAGQSPAGLNSTGESDLRTYYDGVARTQEQRMRRPLVKLLDILARSCGVELPEDFSFKFRPLWMLQETEKAEIANKDATAITTTFNSGLLSQATAMRELRQSSRVTGRFSNITDEDIKQADVEASVPTAEISNQEEDNNDPESSPDSGSGPKADGAVPKESK